MWTKRIVKYYYKSRLEAVKTSLIRSTLELIRCHPDPLLVNIHEGNFKHYELLSKEALSKLDLPALVDLYNRRLLAYDVIPENMHLILQYHGSFNHDN